MIYITCFYYLLRFRRENVYIMNALMQRFSLCSCGSIHRAFLNSGPVTRCFFFYSGILRSNSANPIAPISIIVPSAIRASKRTDKNKTARFSGRIKFITAEKRYCGFVPGVFTSFHNFLKRQHILRISSRFTSNLYCRSINISVYKIVSESDIMHFFNSSLSVKSSFENSCIIIHQLETA